MVQQNISNYWQYNGAHNLPSPTTYTFKQTMQKIPDLIVPCNKPIFAIAYSLSNFHAPLHCGKQRRTSDGLNALAPIEHAPRVMGQCGQSLRNDGTL